MHILEPYFVTMETCLFQRNRSTPPSMMCTTFRRHLTNEKTEADQKALATAQKKVIVVVSLCSK